MVIITKRRKKVKSETIHEVKGMDVKGLRSCVHSLASLRIKVRKWEIMNMASSDFVATS